MDSKKQLLQQPGKRVFHTIVARPGDYQMDIAFMKYSESPKYLKLNEGYSCLLLAVETATRYACASPMKSKEAKEVLDAFNRIAQGVSNEGRPILRLTTDDGKEFNNRIWDQRMDELNVKQYVKEPGDRYSLGVIDRLTRTLKTWIEDWQIEHEDLSWIKALPEIVRKYNAHQISTIGFSPDELKRSERATRTVMQRSMQRGYPARDRFTKIEVGDTVRIRLKPSDQPRANSRLAKPSDKMAKGVQRWSNKVYRVDKMEGWSFYLTDKDGKPAERTYRHHDLLVVPKESEDVKDIFSDVAHQARKERRSIREQLD